MQAPNFAYSLTARKFLALDEQPQLDLSCVRHMINAAEPVDAQSIDRFYAVFEAHGLPRWVGSLIGQSIDRSLIFFRSCWMAVGSFVLCPFKIDDQFSRKLFLFIV